jgi:uncharacterized membrane protein
MNKLKEMLNYFLIGVLAVIPIVVVIQVVIFIESLVTKIFYAVYGYSASYLVTVLAFAVTFAVFSFIGYRAKLGKSMILNAFQKIIERIPLLSTVYRVSKKLMDMISGDKDSDHREVVYIEYPKEGLWVPGYVTNKEGEMYVIYVPTSPNPTSGFTVIVHESKVVKSEMSLEDVTSFIVSVGVDFHKEADVKKLAKMPR